MMMPSYTIFKPFYPLIYALAYPFTMSMGESAEYMLHALLSGENGAFRRGSKGDLLEKGSGYFSTEEAKRKVWEHTKDVTTVV